MTDVVRTAGVEAAGRPGRPRRVPEEVGLFLVLVAMVLAIGIPFPGFFSLASMKTVLRQSAYIGIIAFGMVYLVAMVEIDLSVGGIYAVAGTLAALLIKFHGFDPWLAAAVALAAGTALGALNGVLKSLLGVPLIIVSLGTLSVFFGLNLIISDGTAIYGLPRAHPFFRIFGGDILGLPASIWTALACAIVLHGVLRRTRFGATVRAVGSNAAAADFMGIRLWLVGLYATALVGFLSALAGLSTLAYFSSVDPSTGRTLGLEVVAGVVIGGTSLAGGTGTIIGTALGVVIITVIDSGLVYYGVNPNYSEFFTGIVILLAIALDRVVKRRSLR